MVPGGDFMEDDWDKVFASSEYISQIWEMKIPSPYSISPNVYGYLLDAATKAMYLFIQGFVVSTIENGDDYAPYAETSLSMYEEEDKSLEIDIEYRFTCYKQSIAGYVETENAWIAFQFQQGTNYLNNEGKWTASPATDDKYVKVYETSGLEWKTLHVSAQSVPGDGTLYCRVYKAFSAVNIISDITPYVEVRLMKIQLSGVDTDLVFDTIVSESNNYIPEEIEIMSADLPDVTNNRSLYNGGKYLKLSFQYIPTKTWQEIGSDIEENLVISLARNISDQYLVPTVSYEALIRHAHMSIGSVITDPFDLLTYRVLAIRGYSVADGEMNVTLCEVLGIVNEDIGITDDYASELTDDSASALTNDELELIIS
jgi:hypothetical protein